jgi:hypothetical protein
MLALFGREHAPKEIAEWAAMDNELVKKTALRSQPPAPAARHEMFRYDQSDTRNKIAHDRAYVVNRH